MTPFQFLIDKVHQGKNPYDGFPFRDYPPCWYNDPGAAREVFGQCLDLIKPTIIVEVGSFVGESAIHMARWLKERKIDAAILCVDTWYAGFDHWKGAREKINMRFGRPDLYEKFLANVITYQCHDMIVPLAMDSVGAARVIKWLEIVPQFVYVDASHEGGDVIRDYEAYWDLLPKGGGMLVDDLTNWFPGVLADFARFSGTYNLKPVLAEGEKALVIKP